jgi:hypothetical protein
MLVVYLFAIVFYVVMGSAMAYVTDESDNDIAAVFIVLWPIELSILILYTVYRVPFGLYKIMKGN